MQSRFMLKASIAALVLSVLGACTDDVNDAADRGRERHVRGRPARHRFAAGAPQ
jgi:hypothetical protein